MPFFKMIENVSRHFSKSKKIRVALLIDEFFGGAGTAYGGYELESSLQSIYQMKT